MNDSDQDLASAFANAEAKRAELERSSNRTSATYHQSLTDLIKLYDQCLECVYRLALFSRNETIEDVSTNDLQYLTINFHIAELTSSSSARSRKDILHTSQNAYEQFLRQLDSYDTLSAADCRLLEQFLENKDTFSVEASSDAATKRETKIRRYQEQKHMAASLDSLQQRVNCADGDDEIVRKLRLSLLSKYTHDSFQALESIAQELHILSLMPPDQDRMIHGAPSDSREAQRQKGEYSERLDSPHISAGLSGPLLDDKGKPMRPFTLLGKRQELRQGVFRPDHSLPTMSIDEYLDEERRRGGIIEGGGPQSGIRPQVDEDDLDKADEATMKARAWDDFTEDNPKGAGNTLNRG